MQGSMFPFGSTLPSEAFVRLPDRSFHFQPVPGRLSWSRNYAAKGIKFICALMKSSCNGENLCFPTVRTSSSSSSSSLLFNHVGSSLLFQVRGNVYPTGYYNVTMYIGQPARPYFLDLDTGSDLTWLQCDAPCVRCVEAPHPLYRPSNNLVPFEDPICASLHAPGHHNCEDPTQCDYELEYADGGSSLGVLVKDAFAFNYTNGQRLNPRLALGCGYNQVPGTSYHPLDGILGLGKGKSSIVSQLHSQKLIRNVVGHCLSGGGGGFLFFGDDLYDSSRVVWTSMSSDYTKYYSPGVAELFFGGETTGLKNLPVVFDSGSSYTYLNRVTYQTLTSIMKKELSAKSLKEAPEDETLPLCWKGRRPFKNVHDVKKCFRTLALSFTDGKTRTLFELTPEAYLIISNKGNVCLGILNGAEVGLQDLNVIGAISMQDRLVIFDNEKQMIGWMPTNCDQIPKSKAMNT
ncbi:peptidase A1 domain-containing protein [Citrus sinensis]|nr:aspartic proteinase Asp1 isoform X1 [Citrus x clementina]XP_024949254.1 aspartic proteinase Asp1-like isoform X1 [Citrus sinensis]KAH9668599.1 peptidase A1 domain-containing protein [Citrus sinensis]